MKNKEITFSVSKFKLAQDCIGKFYFRYVEKLKVKDYVYPNTIFGLALHDVVNKTIIEHNEGVPSKKIIKDFIPGLFTVKFLELLNKAKGDKLFYKSKDYNEKKYLEYGEKWSKNTFDFIDKYLIQNGATEISSEKEYHHVDKMKIIGIVDLHYKDKDNNLRILDFKTTKDNTTYYFVSWEQDIQSLVYYYLILKNTDKEPVSFSYFVINKDQKMLFLNSVDYFYLNKEKIDKMFDNLLTRFLSLIERSSDEKLWKPESLKCTFCAYNNICKVKI